MCICLDVQDLIYVSQKCLELPTLSKGNTIYDYPVLADHRVYAVCDGDGTY